ncbi:TolB family protein [Streptomyces sp. NPDC051041]|uniref:TolB family protein n=1 Tax=Streptomyces sp. NPDC051041 TaxID=3365640 RepID=UPI0037B46257
MRLGGRAAAVAAVATVCAAVQTTPAGALELQPGTVYANVTSDDVMGNGPSRYAAISANGRYVAFWSQASNLAPGDTDDVHDVYVKDLRTGRVHWASDLADGMDAGAPYTAPAISADGTRVAFPTLDGTRAYTYDVRTGRTELVSDGTHARFSGANAPSISGNGRYVTFTARSAQDPAGRSRIRLRDLGRGTGEWFDDPAAGDEQRVAMVSLSHDGRRIAYLASDPGADDPEDGGTHVYALDRRTGERTRIDPECEDDPAEHGVDDPVMGPDGRHVVFRFKCRTLRPTGTNDAGDVFLRDLGSGALRRVLGPKPQFATHTGRLSADGRHVVFVAAEEREPRGPLQVIYLLDLRTGRTDMITARPDGTANQRPASGPTLDAHGRAVAYDAVPRDLLGEPSAAGDRQVLVTRPR